MIVVIPALEPDRRLPDLVCDIRRELPDAQVLVVDDGYGPDQLKGLLDVPGDRFEWELNALLAAADAKRRIVQTPIETVYIDANSASHFRPLRDSWRVFRPLLAFAGAGVFCWALELALFLALAGHFNLLAAVVGSRLTSGVVNFALNKLGVFRDHSTDRTWSQVRQYTLLALVLMAVTYAGVEALGLLHVPLWLAKIATDVLGFAVSFAVQRRFIFRARPHGRALKESSGRARQSTATAAS